ncbi:MAG: hypothetical protein EOP06_07645 [Proteobacteria bacterium]|nr:MAG: hypothetical protein EOP06_07645 [Pseudomonadota bacterium]
MLKDLTDDQRKLAEVMSDISERCYSAGWMTNLEFVLWDVLITGERSYGHGKITAQDIVELTELSHRCAAWIYFHDDTEETAMDLSSWTKLFREIVEKYPDTL